MAYWFVLQQSQLMLKEYNKLKSKLIYSLHLNPIPKLHVMEHLLMEFDTN